MSDKDIIIAWDEGVPLASKLLQIFEREKSIELRGFIVLPKQTEELVERV